MQLKRLGPYEIGEPLGKGGMGSVYAATDMQTGQRVAVKVLTPHMAMADGFRERFEAEIESLKTLRHEGIVRLYGYGEQDGVLFYSMELVGGISLEDELKAGRRFNWREVTNIAVQLALALKHAHDHGIVHRDIKPANTILYDEDKVKLADFGIARLFGASQLTTAGGVLGTADYMSPEQADGRPVTARCDQYSLGGVMYALLAGRPPFRAKSLPQMLQLQRFAEPEPVRRFAPDTPEQLERLILQLLAKDPAARFPNMQVLARHLQAMVLALSRPVAEDDSLSGSPADDEPFEVELDRSLETAQTQDDAVARPRRSDSESADVGATGGVASPAAGRSSLANGEVMQTQGDAARPAEAGAVGQSSSLRSARFTTIDESQLRQQATRRRSWLIVAAQAAALAAIIGGMIYLGAYLTRPATSDDLYRAVKSQVNSGGAESLATVEAQIDEFLRRFSQDSRAAELHQYQRQIALDRADRQLQITARRGGASSRLLPIERLYLQAVDAAPDSPAAAVSLLESLLALYGDVPDADFQSPGKESKDPERRQRQAQCVELAHRRLKSLRDELADWTEQQLTELRGRLAAAERLTASNPKLAAAMYRAIIDLHQEEAWAAEIVADARQRLSKLENGREDSVEQEVSKGAEIKSQDEG